VFTIVLAIENESDFSTQAKKLRPSGKQVRQLQQPTLLLADVQRAPQLALQRFHMQFFFESREAGSQNDGPMPKHTPHKTFAKLQKPHNTPPEESLLSCSRDAFGDQRSEADTNRKHQKELG
jgi:hypothetical protein